MAVLGEFTDYLPVTLRQVFYRLVVKTQIEKTENGYARLCEVCNRARRGGLIEFTDIRDDGPKTEMGFDFASNEELTTYLVELRKNVCMDLQSFQERRIFVWCEAAGMVPQLTQTAHPYGITVLSSGGFDSLTMKHDMAQKLSDDSVVLHIGDYDPSGVHIFSSLAEDIQAFGADAEFIRLAVTPEQRDDMDLPTAPPKAADKRSFNDTKTVQCEAISPPDLAEILENAILEHTDYDNYQEALAWQEEIRNG